MLPIRFQVKKSSLPACCSGGKVWLLHALFWIISIFSKTLALNAFLPLESAFWRTLGNELFIISLFYSNFFLVDSYLEKGKTRSFFMLAVLSLVLFSFFRYQFNQIFPEAKIFSQGISEAQRLKVQVVGSNFVYLILSTFYQLIYNRFRNEQRVQAIINEQNEAQLQFLKAQINPHFLFNTLNNIYSLAVIRSEKTSGMVLKLSELLRYVIYEGQAEKVSVPQEVTYIQKYIELFQMRNEEPRSITFSDEGASGDHQMEPMILIPLVENCLKHCDFETNEDAFVRIELEIAESELRFTTVNTRDESNKQKDRTGGVGLENIRKRLLLKYPGKHNLHIENEEKDPIFRVELRIDL
jgi:two-component system LytT family sensor kinase